jgi:SHS2 domain-containing protein
MGRPALAARTRWGTFPTTADMGLWARSSTAEGLFSGLGTGLFAVMTDLRRVRPREVRTVRASAPDPPRLAVAFLSQLILLEDSEQFVGRRVEARLDRDRTTVEAEVRGEPWDGERHSRKIDVKAVTLHGLAVSLDPPSARVILDI